MAITILPKTTSFGESVGQALGQGLAGFGTGIGSGLQALAEQKLSNMQRQQASQKAAAGLEALGFDPAQAATFSQFPEAIQRDIIKQKLQEPQQKAFAQALAALGGETPGMGKGLSEVLSGAGLNEKQATQLAKIASQQEAKILAREKFDFDKTKHKDKLIKEAWDADKSSHDALLKAYRDAESQDKELMRMVELGDTGKLNSPAYLSFIKKLGYDAEFLKSPETGELDKLTVNFLKNASSVFGGRVTNREMETFLRGVPNSNQTEEQRRRVINNFLLINEAAKLRWATRQQIMEEREAAGIPYPPRNIDDEIEKRIGSKLDDISRKFIKGLGPVPIKPQTKKKKEEFVPGESYNKLPDASSVPAGHGFIDEEKGIKWISDGVKWRQEPYGF